MWCCIVRYGMVQRCVIYVVWRGVVRRGVAVCDGAGRCDVGWCVVGPPSSCLGVPVYQRLPCKPNSMTHRETSFVLRTPSPTSLQSTQPLCSPPTTRETPCAVSTPLTISVHTHRDTSVQLLTMPHRETPCAVESPLPNSYHPHNILTHHTPMDSPCAFETPLTSS